MQRCASTRVKLSEPPFVARAAPRVWLRPVGPTISQSVRVVTAPAAVAMHGC